MPTAATRFTRPSLRGRRLQRCVPTPRGVRGGGGVVIVVGSVVHPATAALAVALAVPTLPCLALQSLDPRRICSVLQQLQKQRRRERAGHLQRRRTWSGSVVSAQAQGQGQSQGQG